MLVFPVKKAISFFTNADQAIHYLLIIINLFRLFDTVTLAFTTLYADLDTLRRQPDAVRT